MYIPLIIGATFLFVGIKVLIAQNKLKKQPSSIVQAKWLDMKKEDQKVAVAEDLPMAVTLMRRFFSIITEMKQDRSAIVLQLTVKVILKRTSQRGK